MASPAIDPRLIAPRPHFLSSLPLHAGALTAAYVVGVTLYSCTLRGGFQSVPHREIEKMVDVLQEPSWAADFFFGWMRRDGRNLTPEQRPFFAWMCHCFVSL